MSFVHVQRTFTRKPAGICAHFCPFCRTITVFRVQRLSTNLTINFIPIGRAKPHADELTCTACNLLLGCAPGEVHPIESAEGIDLIDLATRTSPWSYDDLFRRLEMEARLKSGDLSREQRAWLIAEPFSMLEHAAGQLHYLMGKAWMRQLMLLVLFVIIATSATAVILVLVARAPTPLGWALTIFAGAATFALTVILMSRLIRRARQAHRQFVIDPLAASLAFVGATDEEILAACKAHRKSSLGRGTRPKRLIAAVHHRAGAR